MNQIKILRITAGLKQREVAKLLHISQAAVSRWEVGDCKPGIAIMPSLAELYGVTVRDIIDSCEQNQKVV